MSPDLDEISFWYFWETLQGYVWTICKLIWIFCMSVSLLAGLHSYWDYANIEISPVLDDLYFWIILETFLGLGKKIWIILNILYVSQSVCLLTSLPNLDKGISPVLDEISFWFFGDIPRIFLDYIQIILYFLYVCPSVSQSLISLPIGHFWGSTSETSGLVFLEDVWNFINYVDAKCLAFYLYILYLFQVLRHGRRSKSEKKCTVCKGQGHSRNCKVRHDRRL